MFLLFSSSIFFTWFELFLYTRFFLIKYRLNVVVWLLCWFMYALRGIWLLIGGSMLIKLWCLWISVIWLFVIDFATSIMIFVKGCNVILWWKMVFSLYVLVALIWTLRQIIIGIQIWVGCQGFDLTSRDSWFTTSFWIFMTKFYVIMSLFTTK